MHPAGFGSNAVLIGMWMRGEVVLCILLLCVCVCHAILFANWLVAA